MSQPLAPAASRPRAWWLVLTGRVVVFALAAAGSAFALLGGARAPRDATIRYRCPMHFDATAPEPAACPICGMALVRVDRQRPEVAPPARVARATRRRFADPIRAPAWVDAGGAVVALLYRDDAVGLAPGQPAELFAATAPSVGVAVERVAEPVSDWDRATVRARFTGGGARPGAEGSLVLAHARDVVVVPSSAILDAPDGPYLFVVDPVSHRDVRRAVQIGRDHQGVTPVLDGVAEGDEIVVGDAFFVAADHALHPEETP